MLMQCSTPPVCCCLFFGVWSWCAAFTKRCQVHCGHLDLGDPSRGLRTAPELTPLLGPVLPASNGLGLVSRHGLAWYPQNQNEMQCSLPEFPDCNCCRFSRSAKRSEQVWENLHVSPRTAPSRGAKLCTYHYCFGRPGDLRFEPHYELPVGISKLRALVKFRLGSHTLPIEQGHLARPALPCHLCRRTICDTQAVGAELHCVFDCTHFSDIRAQLAGLFQDAAGGHAYGHVAQGPESVCHCLIGLAATAQT